jgi:hypothetical protein
MDPRRLKYFIAARQPYAAFNAVATTGTIELPTPPPAKQMPEASAWWRWNHEAVAAAPGDSMNPIATDAGMEKYTTMVTALDAQKAAKSNPEEINIEEARQATRVPNLSTSPPAKRPNTWARPQATALPKLRSVCDGNPREGSLFMESRNTTKLLTTPNTMHWTIIAEKATTNPPGASAGCDVFIPIVF